MLFFLGVFALSVSVASAHKVTALGQRSSRQIAISDAQRAAVEQGVGTLIDSKTTVANFEVLQDKIYSRASGYIRNFDVISEGKTPDGSTYTVTASA